MPIHRLAMLAILTSVVWIGCDSARDVRDVSAHTNAFGCDNCHGYPPPPSFPSPDPQLHPQGVTSAMCTLCHPGTVQADGHSIVANGEHRDGQIEFVAFDTLTCDACHGTPPITGSHVFHVQDKGLACATCHRGFDPATKSVDATVHMSGQADVILSNGTVIQTANLPDHSWPGPECTACHAALSD
jgi:hypothetical protein